MFLCLVPVLFLKKDFGKAGRDDEDDAHDEACCNTFSYYHRFRASGEAILGSQRYFIKELYTGTLSNYFTQHLYQITLRKHFAKHFQQALNTSTYTSTLHKHFIQALHTSTLSKHFFQALCRVFLTHLRNTCQGITKAL